ncbi:MULTISPECIES: NUDIX domain-containing protein [unclassified Halanaerobium]|uniref:NUDIX domain-containing protein n=1 Tax=unclassified Halanaerobium TaxID=2641197 RepID=UPI0011C01D4D|nr:MULTISPECIES: NUDIX domain-containing protein [unclassified Halanaerobium]
MVKKISEKYLNTVIVVFCYLIKDDKVLLIKRNNPPAQYEYTVVGGKKEKNENLIDACKREVEEETNLLVDNLKLMGIINNFIDGLEEEYLTFYFKTENFTGEIKSSLEGNVQWCNIEESFKKEGISRYYEEISPFVFAGEFFLGDIFVDQEGKIKEVKIKADY